MSNARDGFSVNLTDYKDRASARLTPGSYLVRVTDAETGETKAGDPKVVLFYTVTGGSVHDGAPLVDTLTLTDKALWRIVKVLRALGIKVEKRNMNIPFKLILGRTLVVKVEDGEPYNGQVKSEIRDYSPAASFEGYATESVPVPVDEFPIHEEGQPHQLGTAESEGPLGDEVRAQNGTPAWESEGGSALKADENGEVEVPNDGITL